jgi:transcriptional regulator with XRE-family HTH domain
MPEPLQVLFGRVVRRRREAAELSQERLADTVKPPLSRNFIGMIERGETNPTLSVMESLAVAFDTTVTALIQEAEEGLTAKSKPRSDKKKA